LIWRWVDKDFIQRENSRNAQFEIEELLH
jgi:hypothetical protein